MCQALCWELRYSGKIYAVPPLGRHVPRHLQYGVIRVVMEVHIGF